uniref:Uncharacterized protein n=1 Tax=Alexandrium monilatum TaxID=311494 RepID=A0A7S4UVX7_9DINO
MLETYTLGNEQDYLQWAKIATAWRGAQPSGSDSCGSGGDPTSFHQCTRALHGPQGDAMMTIVVGMGRFNEVNNGKDAMNGLCGQCPIRGLVFRGYAGGNPG